MALVIAVAYFAILIIMGAVYAKKKVKSAEDFANAGGGLGWVMVTFSFVLAPLGSGHTMSLWEKAAGGGFTDWSAFTGIGTGACWWAIGAGYVFFGGMLQMAWLNCINAIVMIVASYSAIAIIAVHYLSALGGWDGVRQVYDAAGYSNILTQTGTLGMPPVWLGVIIPVIVLHTTAGAVSQTMMQPFFAAKNESACRKGVFLGCSFNIMSSLPWIFLGIAAMSIPAIASKVGPNGLEAVPSIAQAVLANSNVIANDIVIGCACPDADAKKKLRINKICIIIAAALLLPGAIIMAHEFVFNLFLWVFSFGMPIFVVFIIGYNFKVSKKAAWATVIVTYIINCIWTFCPMGKILHLPDGSIWGMNMYATMVASVVLGIVFHLIFPGKEAWKKSHADVIAANEAAQAQKA